MEEVEQEMPGARDVSARASRVLLDWIANLRVDRELEGRSTGTSGISMST